MSLLLALVAPKVDKAKASKLDQQIGKEKHACNVGSNV